MNGFQSGEIGSALEQLRRDCFSGILEVEGAPEGTPSAAASESFQYFILFQAGEMVYAGSKRLDVESLATLLAEERNSPLIKMVFRVAGRQVAQPDSVTEVLAQVIAKNILTWPQVEEALLRHACRILVVLNRSAGSLRLQAGEATELRYGDSLHRLNWPMLMAAVSGNGPLPAADPSAAAPEDNPAPNPPEPIQPATAAPAVVQTPAAALPRVLSVDDSPIVQKMIQRALQHCSEVILVNNALAALQVLNGDRAIDLVLLDINMPGINGLDFCRTVRSIGKFKDLPIVMLTANESLAQQEMGRLVGSTLYLTKPVDGTKLLEIIQQYTGPGREQSALAAS